MKCDIQGDSLNPRNRRCVCMPLSSPAVSVVVPIYKVERYLVKCVDSILAQTLREIEVILVDDGSPDACPALCDAYAARDPRGASPSL